PGSGSPVTSPTRRLTWVQPARPAPSPGRRSTPTWSTRRPAGLSPHLALHKGLPYGEPVVTEYSGRMTVAPELRPALRWIPRPPVQRAWARRLVRFVLQRYPAARVDGGTVEPTGDVRVFRPATRQSDGALLWIHGGGLVIGRAVQDDRICGTAARELGIVVVSVEYRKAPEHPFPAALDDCYAAWEWLQ